MTQARLFLKDIQQDAIAGPYPDFMRKYCQPNMSLENTSNISNSLRKPSNYQDVVRWLDAAYRAADPVHRRRWSALPNTMQLMHECPGTAFVLERQDREGWDQTLMVGFAVDDTQFSYPLSLAQLYAVARQAFLAQPFRHSLHGLLFYGDFIELWVFDRSGMYCSEPLSFDKYYNAIVSAILAYACKTDEELGIKQYVQVDKAGTPFIQYTKGERLVLENHPFVDREHFFGEGMVCFRARREHEGSWTLVVKFKWRDEEDKSEHVTYNQVARCDIKNVVSLLWCEETEQTKILRSTLRHRRCRDLHLEPQTDELNTQGTTRYTTQGRSFFGNRIFTCLVFAPLGGPLTSWGNKLELLTVLRDAIQAHRDLLQKAHILHRDISTGNIVIIDSPSISKGILIDLDRAMNLDEEQPVAGTFVGTRMFTAIGLLNLEAQTYRHDLESFFYLFVWLVTCDGQENLPDDSLLVPWSEGRRQSADAKLKDMAKARFEMILAQFNSKYDSLKELAWDLRAVIFRPSDNDELWLGTDTSEQGVDAIYDMILNSFEKAIDKQTADSIVA